MKSTVKIILLTIVGILLSTAGYFAWTKYIKMRMSPAKITPVTVRLKWFHQAQFAGHYVADKRGYYKEQGITVTLLPFDYKNFPIDDVVSGKAQFGVAGADEVLIAREQGKKVVAIATIYQENPVVAYALKASGIKTPRDFIGKKIGIESGINVETIVRAMLTSQGVNWDTSITKIPIGFDIKALINKKVDVATGYITNEPISAEEAGYPVTIIEPRKYGVKLYADVLITSEETVQKNPKLVQNFVQATLRGWEYAVSHIDEAVSMTLQYPDANNTAMTAKHQKALLETSVAYIKPTKGFAIGHMSYLEWKKTQNLLKEYNVIRGDEDVTHAYTTLFY